MSDQMMSAASFRALYERLRGQAQWGAADRRGALNHITPARLVAAATEIRLGRTVTLAAPLAIVPAIPIQALALLLGIDKFKSEVRALTNLIGNGVATVVISRWEGELDADALHETMAHPVTLGEEFERLPA